MALLFFLSALGALGAWASEPEISILSYNIKGLPSVVNQSWDEERYGEIGAILSRRGQAGAAPEVVLIQEGFADRVGELWQKASYPHRARGPLPTSLLGVCGGLYVLSQHPILETHAEAFGPGLCAGWDCLSNKGVMLARIQLPGQTVPLEVYNTHMQASRAQDTVRREQVKKLAAFFKKHHRPGAPVVFGGDFNFRPGSKHESYQDFLSATGLRHSAELCLNTPQGYAAVGGRSALLDHTVDHQFTNESQAGPRLAPVRAERNFQPTKGRRLSDHLGYEVRYRIVSPPAPAHGKRPAQSMASHP